MPVVSPGLKATRMVSPSPTGLGYTTGIGPTDKIEVIVTETVSVEVTDAVAVGVLDQEAVGVAVQVGVSVQVNVRV